MNESLPKSASGQSAPANTPSRSDPGPPRNLETPVQYLSGVGPKRAELLSKLGIERVVDLLAVFPTGVNDFSDVRPANRLEADIEQSVHGRIVDKDSRTLRNNRSLVGVLLDCNGHFVRGVWFNQPWMFRRFQEGSHVVFSGKPRWRDGRWEFSSPRVHWLTDSEDMEEAVGVLPRYALTDGLRMEQMRLILSRAVEDFSHLVSDPVPFELLQKHKQPPLSQALHWLHKPSSMQEFQDGRYRMLFDDLLEFQIGMALRKKHWSRTGSSPVIPVSARVNARIRRLFPFRFTDGQDMAIREVCTDLNRPVPMHRLLQADVGAGKTVVAAYALLTAIAEGLQGILMAPTEVLATQHYETFREILRDSRVRIGYLRGGLKARERRELLDGIRSGEIHLIIGTQAVIQDSVVFHRAGVAIIDEQHRFGVRQRAAFSRADHQPHILVMTATPIPRSLCLTQYGDLDISSIRELPPGRQKVITARLVSEPEHQRAWDFIRGKIKDGRQLYIVCPRVEGSSEDDDAAAETYFQRLLGQELKNIRVGLLHGRMPREERMAVMDRFRDRELDALVSTTVIEVGVNIPNATLMMVRQAERFGLAQLHQLRGRICRGRFQGYCFLSSQAEDGDAAERLVAMEQTSDGFELAERDAELRGPGDLLGTRQSGRLPLRYADPVRDLSIVRRTRKIATELVRSNQINEPEYQALRHRVLLRFADVLDLPQSG